MKKIALLSLVTLVFISCGQNNTQKAQDVLQSAEQAFAVGDLERTEAIIDSLHQTYPREVSTRREADTLLWKAIVKDITQNMPTIDSTLSQLLKRAEEIARDYKFEKDTRFQIVGDYEHKSLQTAQNTGRTYLKPIADEDGGFRLISTLCGQKISHTQIIATAGVASYSTTYIDEGSLNTYDQLGVTYEVANFSDPTAVDMAMFIGENANGKIKITLKGSSKDYTYELSEREARIIGQTAEFASLLQDVAKYQRIKQEKQRLLEVMQLRISKE